MVVVVITVVVVLAGRVLVLVLVDVFADGSGLSSNGLMQVLWLGL